MKIDVVITWVDGNDPVLNAKRAQYSDKKTESRADVGSSTRYADLGEIHYCVRSINKFASFVNKIYIITDGQDPHVESRIPVEIVDHKQIFKGYEEYLPVFNSISIETLSWRIPELSEHFLQMNDDFVIIKPVAPEDFFTEDGKPVCYGRLYSTLWAKSLYGLSVLKYRYWRATFKLMLMKGSRKGGMRWSFVYLVHTPRAFLKSFFENYYEAHPEDIVQNVKYRFRDRAQYQNQSMHYSALLKKKEAVMCDPSDKLLFIQHWKGPEYISRKLSRAQASPECVFACFNSLDLATEGERKLVLDWLDAILG